MLDTRDDNYIVAAAIMEGFKEKGGHDLIIPKNRDLIVAKRDVQIDFGGESLTISTGSIFFYGIILSKILTKAQEVIDSFSVITSSNLRQPLNALEALVNVPIGVLETNHHLIEAVASAKMALEAEREKLRFYELFGPSDLGSLSQAEYIHRSFLTTYWHKYLGKKPGKSDRYHEFINVMQRRGIEQLKRHSTKDIVKVVNAKLESGSIIDWGRRYCKSTSKKILPRRQFIEEAIDIIIKGLETELRFT